MKGSCKVYVFGFIFGQLVEYGVVGALSLWCYSMDLLEFVSDVVDLVAPLEEAFGTFSANQIITHRKAKLVAGVPILQLLFVQESAREVLP